DLAVGLLRLAQPAGLGDRRGTVVAGNEPWDQRIQYLGRCRKVTLQRIHAEESAFVVIEIGEVEAHFALAGSGNFNEPAADGEAVDGAPEHDAADQIEHDIRALAVGRRTRRGRQVLGAYDQLLRDGMNRRV